MTLSAHSAALARIVTIARAGSLAHASALFRAAGFDRADQDAAALAVKGRLAKDRALQAPAGERPLLLAEAAAAYAAADALLPQPYTRINQATLAWLAGDRAGGETLARALLAWLDRGDHPPETAYWLAATRAEALLLLGDTTAAATWLGRAVATQPEAWEDQAATLRQLGLILAARGEAADWLEPLRPGKVIHFAGHLGIAPTAAAALEAQVSALLADHRVIAGHGALAAGADLVIAAALLARGAELHVVLPTQPDVFTAQSVAPYGPFWVELYRRVAAEAASLRAVTTLGGSYQPLAMQLATDMAMGAARLHARRFETTALQVLVTDGPGFGQGAATARFGVGWNPPDAPEPAAQVCVVEPRTAEVAPSATKPGEGRADLRLVALLQVAGTGLDDDAGDADPDGAPRQDAAFATLVDHALAPFRARMADRAPRPDCVLAAPDGFIAGFTDLDRAWAYAAAALTAAADLPAIAVTGHYGLVHDLSGADAAAPLLAGGALARLARARGFALPGILVASDSLAAALAVRHAAELTVEEIGEDDAGTLFALRPRSDP